MHFRCLCHGRCIVVPLRPGTRGLHQGTRRKTGDGDICTQLSGYPCLIRDSIGGAHQPGLKLFLKLVPMSFFACAADEQVDALKSRARSLLRENEDFQNLLTEIHNEQ